MSDSLTPEQQARIDRIRRIVKRMRTLRRRCGMSRPRLAELAALPVGRLRAYEELVQVPSTYDLAHIAAALGTTLEQLER